MSRERGNIEVTGRVVKCGSSGYECPFNYQDMHLYAKEGATTTAITCAPIASLPIGLRFKLDNTNGSGDLTLTPTGGSPITIAAGKIFDVTIAADHSAYAAESTAAP